MILRAQRGRREREFFIKFEFPFPGSLMSTFLIAAGDTVERGELVAAVREGARALAAAGEALEKAAP